MATITRTEEMFTYTSEAATQTSFLDSLQRVLSRIFMPDWVILYAEEKAEEITRNQFYYS
jgi:hypothetical protein